MIDTSNMVKIFCIILCMLFFFGESYAQDHINLVPNGSFEAYNECPRDFSCVDRVGTPSRYLRNWATPTFGTPDHYHTCFLSVYTSVKLDEVGVPFNIGGTVPAVEGEGYAGIYLFVGEHLDDLSRPYREYLQVRLEQPMVAGLDYCFSFYVRPMDTLAHPAGQGTTLYATQRIGAYFSADQPTDTSLISVSPWNGFAGLLHQQPQIQADSTTYQQGVWTLVTGTYRAQGGEEWLTIGNFDNDTVTFADLRLLRTGNPGAQIKQHVAYYFIDEVELHALDRVRIFPYEGDYPVCDAFPVTIAAMPDFSNYHWNTGATTPAISVLDTGLYWVEARYEGCVKSARDSIRVVALPPPVVDLGPDISLCEAGQLQPSVLRNAAVLDNYRWSTGLVYDSIVVARPGTYRLTTEHVCGSFSDDIEVSGCVFNLYLPNVITPESNDINAVFAPWGENMELLLLEIYDNWGHRLYQGFSTDSQWDGRTTAGRWVTPGVYVYKVRIRNTLDGTESERIGDLTVVR